MDGDAGHFSQDNGPLYQTTWYNPPTFRRSIYLNSMRCHGCIGHLEMGLTLYSMAEASPSARRILGKPKAHRRNVF